MYKRIVIGVGIVVGVLAIAVPIAASLNWAKKQNLAEQQRRVDRAASEVLRRMDLMADEAFEMFSLMKAAKATAPCSRQNIQLMRRIALQMGQLKAVGYVENNYMVCSSFGQHNATSKGIPLGPPSYRSPLGSEVRTSVRFDNVTSKTFLASTDTSTGYTALIDADQALLVNTPDVSMGVFFGPTKTPLVTRGDFNPRWIDVHGTATAEGGRYLVALKHSSRYTFASFAAIEQSTVSEGLEHAAMLMVPAGVGAGLILAIAVIYVTRSQMSTKAMIRVGLRRREFFLVYQPVVELQGGKCVGAEALIRWRRQDGTMVRPDVFIPEAEESGLIHEITKEVFRLVAQDTASFLKEHPHLHIGINLSSKDLMKAETVHLVCDLIRKMGVKPHNLIIEATERGFMQADVAQRIIDDIHGLDVKIAIDDFGTGYSSLSCLENFHLDYLKIDKSFIDTIGGDAATSHVASHIIEMARSLNLEMIAEGVETEEQRCFLERRGVQYAQGYLFAKPLPFTEFVEYVAKTEKSSDPVQLGAVPA